VVAPAAGVVTSRPDASVVSVPALGSQRGALGSSGSKVVQAHQEELRGGKRDVNPGPGADSHSVVEMPVDDMPLGNEPFRTSVARSIRH
jgi:hypothetical protein